MKKKRRKKTDAEKNTQKKIATANVCARAPGAAAISTCNFTVRQARLPSYYYCTAPAT